MSDLSGIKIIADPSCPPGRAYVFTGEFPSCPDSVREIVESGQVAVIHYPGDKVPEPEYIKSVADALRSLCPNEQVIVYRGDDE